MCLPFTYYINDLSLARRAFAHELPSMTKRRKVVPARLPLQVQSGARYRHTWAPLFRRLSLAEVVADTAHASLPPRRNSLMLTTTKARTARRNAPTSPSP